MYRADEPKSWICTKIHSSAAASAQEDLIDNSVRSSLDASCQSQNPVFGVSPHVIPSVGGGCSERISNFDTSDEARSHVLTCFQARYQLSAFSAFSRFRLHSHSRKTQHFCQYRSADTGRLQGRDQSLLSSRKNQRPGWCLGEGKTNTRPGSKML